MTQRTKYVSPRAALKHVSDYPNMLDDNLLTKPTWELLARTLFRIANSGDDAVRGSMSRANKARGLLMDRMDGRRKAGTKPAGPSDTTLEFTDLTGGALDGPKQEAEGGAAGPA